jgi:hypothetical protein
LSTAFFTRSRTSPSVVRLLNNTTRMMCSATRARYMLSSTPWWYRVEKSFSPISLASWALASKSAAHSEAKLIRSNSGSMPTLAMSCPVLSIRMTLVELEFSMSSLMTELMAQ